VNRRSPRTVRPSPHPVSPTGPARRFHSLPLDDRPRESSPCVISPQSVLVECSLDAEVQAAKAPSTRYPIFESTLSICGRRGRGRRQAAGLVPAIRDEGSQLRRGSHGPRPGRRVHDVGADRGPPRCRSTLPRRTKRLSGRLRERNSCVEAPSLHPHQVVRDVALGGRPLTFGNLEKAYRRERARTSRLVAGQFDPSVTWRPRWLREHCAARLP